MEFKLTTEAPGKEYLHAYAGTTHRGLIATIINWVESLESRERG